MRHFAAQSRTINLVRKVGYYPSAKVAKRCAEALCYVIEASELADLVQRYLMGDGDAWQQCISKLTPAEYRVILGFSDWYSGERSNPLLEDMGSYTNMDLENILSSYIACNLNNGAHYVFTANRIENSWKTFDGEALHPDALSTSEAALADEGE